jgi:hypothetical protein
VADSHTNFNFNMMYQNHMNFIIIPNYCQRDATFLGLFIFTDNLHVLYRDFVYKFISNLFNSIITVWQYLMLYVQICAPDDGWRNCLKHVQRL